MASNNSKGWKLVKIPYILGGLLLLILSISSMTNGTKKMLNSNNETNTDKDDNRISYDENTDTYTYTIWEDEEFKNNSNVINVTIEP